MTASVPANVRETTSKRGPVIVDLGRKSSKAIKKLTKGSGKLMEEIQGCIAELRTAGAISADVLPVIIVVKKKAKRDGLNLFR